MDPVTLIVTALSAGLASALQDDAKAAYQRLREKLKRLVKGRPDAELALERHETAPKKWEALLAAELTEAGAADDADLMAEAQALMKLIDAVGSRVGKYNVTIKDAKGVQIGDHNVQVNRFGD